MASITKLPSGAYRVQIRRKGRYASETFLLRDDAHRWARQAETRVDQGLAPNKSSVSRLATFSDLIDLHIVDMCEVGKPPRRSKAATLTTLNHPLAHFEQLRLRQCYEHPLAMPGVGFGSRAMVDAALQEKSYARSPELESNSFEYLKAHVAKTMAVTFQIESGAPLAPVQDTYLTARLIDVRDVAPGTLWMGQLAGRSLSVAASRFSKQIGRDLSERYQHV